MTDLGWSFNGGTRCPPIPCSTPHRISTTELVSPLFACILFGFKVRKVQCLQADDRLLIDIDLNTY